MFTVEQFLGTRPSDISTFYRHPTCTNFERNFQKIFTLWQDPTPVLYQGHELLAAFYKGQVRGLSPWVADRDSQEVVILVKNPSGSEGRRQLENIGTRNCLLEAYGILFAAEIGLRGIAITRPVRTPYQTSFRDPFTKLKLSISERNLPNFFRTYKIEKQ